MPKLIQAYHAAKPEREYHIDNKGPLLDRDHEPFENESDGPNLTYRTGPNVDYRGSRPHSRAFETVA